jgi:hypothetical protein
MLGFYCGNSRSKATARFTTLSLMLEPEGGEDSDENDEEEDEE